MYLWHDPLLDLRQLLWPHVTPGFTAGAVGAAFILAFLTYKYIELPLRSSRNTTVIAGSLCAAMVACGSVGYPIYTGAIPARPESFEVRKFASAATEDWLPGTHDTPWTPASDSFLTLGAASRLVLYVGDSNMQQYYPRIAKTLSDHPLNSHGAVFCSARLVRSCSIRDPGQLGCD
jgi:hypothetical protein